MNFSVFAEPFNATRLSHLFKDSCILSLPFTLCLLLGIWDANENVQELPLQTAWCLRAWNSHIMWSQIDLHGQFARFLLL